jgi:hypothetical protein
MRRVLIVALLLASLLPSSASGNGCPAPCSGQSVSPPDGKLLFVQPSGDRGPVVAYDTKNGVQRFALPAGVSSADGNWHVSVTRAGRLTRLVRFFVRTGQPVRAWTIRGTWHAAGLSPQGRWVALTRRSHRPLRTTVAIVDADRARTAHLLTLRGDFEVETVSVDGKRLFLIEHLNADGAPRYLVRLYDLSRDRLHADPLRARGEDKLMTGYAWSGIGSPDGRWLLTLYLNTSRSSAFVHALHLGRSSPACIDLPSGGGAFERLKHYSLTLSPDGKTLFAANPALGAVAAIDLSTRRVVRTARFAADGGRVVEAAARLGGTISRNGRTLYFSSGRDLWAYDAAYGKVRGPYRTNGRLVGFGFGMRDRTVVALRSDGRMLVFDAATGRRLR